MRRLLRDAFLPLIPGVLLAGAFVNPLLTLNLTACAVGLGFAYAGLRLGRATQ